MERIDLGVPKGLELVRASLEWKHQRWELVLVPPAGPSRRIPFGTCACHGRRDCPGGFQEKTAMHILRGDHPDVLRVPA